MFRSPDCNLLPSLSQSCLVACWRALFPMVGLGFVIGFATGCAGPRYWLKPEQVAQVHRTDVYAYLPQPEVGAEWLASGYGSGGGLIGAIVDAAVNSGRQKSAEARVQELRNAIGDVDFRALYWPAVSNAVCQTPWLKVGQFQTFPTAVPRLNASAVVQGAALVLGSNYRLSQDCRVLEVTTGFDFYLPQKHRKLAALNIMAYHSVEIGTPDGDQAIPLWTANGGAAYRRAVAEGVAQSAILLRHALELLGGVSSAAARPAKLRARLLHARGDFGIAEGRTTFKGTVLEETPERVIVYLKNGRLFSLPRPEVEVTYLRTQ